MNRKFHVSLEAARLLKEKGYNEECDCVIDDDGDIFEHQYQMNQDLPEWECSCPTKSEAIDWLENKGITISPHPVTILHEDGTTATHWGCYINQKDGAWYTVNDLPTRLEAEDAAIIKACELLWKN